MFSAGTVQFTGSNIAASLPASGFAGRVDGVGIVITSAANGTPTQFLVDATKDGVVSSVHAAYTAPGALVTYGDLTGTSRQACRST